MPPPNSADDSDNESKPLFSSDVIIYVRTKKAKEKQEENKYPLELPDEVLFLIMDYLDIITGNEFVKNTDLLIKYCGGDAEIMRQFRHSANFFELVKLQKSVNGWLDRLEGVVVDLCIEEKKKAESKEAVDKNLLILLLLASVGGLACIIYAIVNGILYPTSINTLIAVLSGILGLIIDIIGFSVSIYGLTEKPTVISEAHIWNKPFSKLPAITDEAHDISYCEPLIKSLAKMNMKAGVVHDKVTDYFNLNLASVFIYGRDCVLFRTPSQHGAKERHSEKFKPACVSLECKF